jgi:hypothetical protein
MAEKKKVKNIKDGTGAGDGATITVGDVSTSTTSGGTAVATTPDIMFDQPNFKALCFNIGDILNVETILLAGSTTPTVVTARRIQRGTVLTTNTTNNGGTIEENKSKKVINFSQAYLKETGIMAGTEVKYDLIQDYKTGGEIAVNVEVQP